MKPRKWKTRAPFKVARVHKISVRRWRVTFVSSNAVAKSKSDISVTNLWKRNVFLRRKVGVGGNYKEG